MIFVPFGGSGIAPLELTYTSFLHSLCFKALRDYVLRSAYIHIHNLLIKFRSHTYYSGGVDYDRLRAFGDRKQPVERCGVTYIPFHDFCA